MNNKRKEIYFTNDNNCCLKDVILAKLVVFHLYLMLCKNMLVATNEYIRGFNNIFNGIIIIIIALAYVCAFRKIYISRHKIEIPQMTGIIICFLGCFLLISSVMISNLFTNAGVIAEIRVFIPYCLPLFVIVSMMDEPGMIMRCFYLYKNIPFMFAVVGFLLYEFTMAGVGEYSMSYGYSSMFICLVFIYCYCKNRHIWDLIAAVALLSFVFFAGSRGAIYHILLTIMLIVLLKEKGRKKGVIILMGLFAVVVMLFVYVYSRAHYLYNMNMVSSLSRNLNMIMNGSVLSDSGRGEIFEDLIYEINKHPVIGLGMHGGSRVVYLAHSIFLDIFANFGYIFGSVIILVILYKIIRLYICYGGSDLGDLVLFLAVIALGGGFFTGEFFQSKELWMLFGVFSTCSKGRVINRLELFSCKGKRDDVKRYS